MINRGLPTNQPPDPPPTRARRRRLSWGSMRRMIFLSSFTLVWLLFLIWASAPLLGIAALLRSALVGAGGAGAVFRLIGVYVALIAGFGIGVRRINQRQYSLLNQISNMKGMSWLYVTAALAALAVSAISYDHRAPFELHFTAIFSGLSLLVVAIPTQHEDGPLAQVMREARDFFSSLPLVGRFIRPSEVIGAARASQTTAPASSAGFTPIYAGQGDHDESPADLFAAPQDQPAAPGPSPSPPNHAP